MSSLQEVRTPQEGRKQRVRAVQHEDNMLQHEDNMLQHKDNMHGVMEAKQESAGRGRGAR